MGVGGRSRQPTGRLDRTQPRADGAAHTVGSLPRLPPRPSLGLPPCLTLAATPELRVGRGGPRREGHPLPNSTGAVPPTGRGTQAPPVLRRRSPAVGRSPPSKAAPARRRVRLAGPDARSLGPRRVSDPGSAAAAAARAKEGARPGHRNDRPEGHLRKRSGSRPSVRT